jgi:hypothetical protein
MSKFLLNLLVQISKAFVYSKIKILFRNNSPQLSAHPAFRPSCEPFFFFFPTGRSPLPTGPQPLGRPSRPARQWRPVGLPPPPHEDASSRATFALSLRPADRWTPPIISHLRPDRARPRRHHLPPLPAPPSPTSNATRTLPPRHHFLLLNPPLNLAPASNGVNAINTTVTPPGHPSPALHGPL